MLRSSDIEYGLRLNWIGIVRGGIVFLSRLIRVFQIFRIIEVRRSFIYSLW